MAWELGNELEGMTLPWIDEQVAYIRERAPEQFVAAGRRFDIDPDTLASQTSTSSMCITTRRPPSGDSRCGNRRRGGKVYIAGEYGSTASTPRCSTRLRRTRRLGHVRSGPSSATTTAAASCPTMTASRCDYPGTTAKMRDQVDAIRATAAPGVRAGTLALGQPLVTSCRACQRRERHHLAWNRRAATYRVEVVADGSHGRLSEREPSRRVGLARHRPRRRPRLRATGSFR